jgi:hypothetical protein
VKTCLQKNESSRYASGTALVAHLENAMAKAQIARDRRQLAAYVKDPAQYEAAFAEKTITECLARGATFMQNGRTHLEEAVTEYRRVLFLDPSNERALTSLDRLRAQKNTGAHTVAVDAVAPVAAAAAATRLHARSTSPAKSAPARPSVPTWAIGVVAALALLGAGSVWFLHARATVGAAQRQEALALNANQSPVGTHAVTRDSTTVATKSSGAASPVTKPTMNASTSDNALTPITDTTPAPKPVEKGSLSVYFLGGVGDVWIDGKLFPRQPPFEKAPLSAGTHRISCHMSGDNQSQEVTVTIRSGKETVIEYEVGAKPVVSGE